MVSGGTLERINPSAGVLLTGTANASCCLIVVCFNMNKSAPQAHCTRNHEVYEYTEFEAPQTHQPRNSAPGAWQGRRARAPARGQSGSTRACQFTPMEMAAAGLGTETGHYNGLVPVAEGTPAAPCVWPAVRKCCAYGNARMWPLGLKWQFTGNATGHPAKCPNYNPPCRPKGETGHPVGFMIISRPDPDHNTTIRPGIRPDPGHVHPGQAQPARPLRSGPGQI